MGWIKSGNHTLDAAQFDERARRTAAVFEHFGVHSGDGVALYLRNDLAYFEAVFGAGMRGIYPVPVNWHYTPDEANYLLTDSGVKLLLIHADFYDPIKQAIPADLPVVIVETPPEVREAFGLGEVPVPPGLPLWGDLIDAAQPWQGEAGIASVLRQEQGAARGSGNLPQVARYHLTMTLSRNR